MTTIAAQQENKSKLIINILSIVIPITVAGMLAFPNKLDLGGWTKNLSHAIGLINTLTTVALIFGLIFIKRKKVHLHRLSMAIAFALGALFLVFYVIYHSTNPANKFTGEGAARAIYLTLLFSHIALSLVVLPLVLRAMFYAVTKQFEKHKKIVKFAYPIWLYVSATGVIVYAMLYHLFPAK